MLFFQVLFFLTFSVTAGLFYLGVGMSITFSLWDKYSSDLKIFIGLFFLIFWISIPIAGMVYYKSAVSSAG